MKILLTLILIFHFNFFFTSCTMSKKYSDKELASILAEMYEVPFTILSNEFQSQLQNHQFKALAIEDPKVIINGSYIKKGDDVNANYPQMVYLNQAKSYFDQILNQFTLNYRFKVSGATEFNYSTGQEIGFKDVYSIPSNSKSLEFQIYFFGPYTKSFPEDYLIAVLELIDQSRQFAPLYLSVNTIFWKEDAFPDKNISDLQLGFNTVSNEYDDDILTRKEKADKISQIVIKKLTQESDITVEQLSETVVDYGNRGKLHLLGE